jgi:multicomponent Na+:H+ antiporter subunit G
MTAVDVIASMALILGAAMSLAAGLAVLRFPDAASRMHAATKAQVLGIMLLMIGLGLRLGTIAVVGELVLIVVLQMFTAPVAAHLAVRQAVRPNGDSPRGATAAGPDENAAPDTAGHVDPPV